MSAFRGRGTSFPLPLSIFSFPDRGWTRGHGAAGRVDPWFGVDKRQGGSPSLRVAYGLWPHAHAPCLTHPGLAMGATRVFDNHADPSPAAPSAASSSPAGGVEGPEGPPESPSPSSVSEAASQPALADSSSGGAGSAAAPPSGPPGDHTEAGPGEGSEAAAPDGPGPAETRDELTALREKLKEAEDRLKVSQAEVVRLTSTLERSYNELSSMRQRLTGELEQAQERWVGKFALRLLDVSDNLARALGAVDKHVAELSQKSSEHDSDHLVSKALTSVKEGMEMTSSALAGTFRRFSVVEYHPLGETFDSVFHEAIGEVPYGTTRTAPDPADPNKQVPHSPGEIGHVLATGFIINNRVLRPARVMVVGPKPPEDEAKPKAKAKAQPEPGPAAGPGSPTTSGGKL